MTHTFAICAYQESPYLEECIRSLKAQTVKGGILLVTSTPNDYISGLAETYQIPCYTNKDGGGITRDWNFGYTCAKKIYRSKYITIAHQDDYYEPEYREKMLKIMKRSRRPLIFFSDYYEIRDGKNVSNNRLLWIKRGMLLPLRIPGTQGSRWIRRRILSFGSPICCPSVTYAAEELPGEIFTHHFRACEDWEAWERLSKLRGEFLYCPQKLMGHRIHRESETSAIIGDHKRSAEEFEMFCKFWPHGIAKILCRWYAKGQDSNQL